MKLLLAIFTCHRYSYNSDPDTRDWFTRPVTNRVAGIRDTWLKDVTCDYKFFFGRTRGRTPLPDEVFLDCNDDYHHSSEKLKAIVNYTLDKDYDRLLKIDDDVWAYWDRVMANIPEGDYAGGGPFGPGDAYCSGMTYWLTRRSMEILSKAPMHIWAEDRWVGEVMRRNHIPCNFDKRYKVECPTRTNQYMSDEDIRKPNEYLTVHSLSPDQMRRYWGER
jgi:hypothetical protein